MTLFWWERFEWLVAVWIWRYCEREQRECWVGGAC